MLDFSKGQVPALLPVYPVSGHAIDGTWPPPIALLHPLRPRGDRGGYFSLPTSFSTSVVSFGTPEDRISGP